MKRALTFILLAALCWLPQASADRLQTSGFETNNLTVTEWGATGSPAIVTTPVHSGTYSLELTNVQKYVNRSFTSSTTGTFYGRVYVYIKTGFGSSASYQNLILFLGAANGCSADFNPTAQKFQVLNPITTTAVTMSGTLSVDTWYRLELRTLLSDTVGECELRVYSGDSTTALETLSITAEDTLPTNLSSVRFGNIGAVNWSTGNVFLDDIALNKSTGTFQTSWPGPGKIALVKPASNDTVTWTKTGANCSGTTNTDCVDDEPGTPDDASGYNSSATANNEDRLNKSALPAEVTSDADMILIAVYSRWDGNGTTGTRQGRVLLWDEASAQTNGPTHSRCDVAAGTWSIDASAETLVFDLGTRTKANVDNANFDLGYEPLNSAECRVTAIWGNVEWIEAPAAPTCSTRMALTGVGC